MEEERTEVSKSRRIGVMESKLLGHCRGEMQLRCLQCKRDCWARSVSVRSGNRTFG